MCSGILVGLVLNPTLLYAKKTTYRNFTIYHNLPLDEHFTSRLDNAAELVKGSELYDENLTLDICLNDGSLYPRLMEALRGPAFGWGFYDKVVLMGTANYKDNSIELNGYKWNLTQLMAHEVTHCLQFHWFGLWKSNPIANHPNWKWEGYPEYVARRNTDQLNLTQNLQRRLTQESPDNNAWAIHYSDSTIAPRHYDNARLMVQYCLDIKKMTYEALLKDTTHEQTITSQMLNWFAKHKMD